MLMVLESSPDTDFKTQDEQRKIKPDFAQFLAPQTPGGELFKMLECGGLQGMEESDSKLQQSENHELQAFLMQNSCSEIKDDEDIEDGFKKLKGGFNNREKLMGSTIRDLGNTIKEAKNFLKSKKAGELQLDQIN